MSMAHMPVGAVNERVLGRPSRVHSFTARVYGYVFHVSELGRLLPNA